MPHSSKRREDSDVLCVVGCLAGVAAFSLLHFVTSFGLRLSLGFYDTVEDRGETTALWEAGRVVLLILWFPAWKIAEISTVNEWAVLICNSVLWGAVLFSVFLVVVRRLGLNPGRVSMRTLILAITFVAILLGIASAFSQL